MKKYEKPSITTEEIVLEDVIAVSKVDSTSDGITGSIKDFFTTKGGKGLGE